MSCSNADVRLEAANAIDSVNGKDGVEFGTEDYLFLTIRDEPVREGDTVSVRYGADIGRRLTAAPQCAQAWKVEVAVDCDGGRSAPGSGFFLVPDPPVIEFVADMAERQIAVITSGVFHGGFLTGGKAVDGRMLRPDDEADRPLLAWRKSFVALCEGHGVAPIDACARFGLSVPGVVAVRFDTSHPDRVAADVDAVTKQVPNELWESMKEEGLIAEDWPFFGQVGI